VSHHWSLFAARRQPYPRFVSSGAVTDEPREAESPAVVQTSLLTRAKQEEEGEDRLLATE